MSSKPTYQCPVCDTEDLPLSKIFLKQEPKDTPKPFICTECIRGLFYLTFKDEVNPNTNISH